MCIIENDKIKFVTPEGIHLFGLKQYTKGKNIKTDPAFGVYNNDSNIVLLPLLAESWKPTPQPHGWGLIRKFQAQ